ncbi:MAG: hypothetical protein ACK5XX_05275 [Holosporales bacterium]|jgi:hypothetical protein
MVNAPMNFLFEEFLRNAKLMLYVFTALSLIVILDYIRKPNLYSFTLTIKELNYVSQSGASLEGGASSLLQSFAGVSEKTENLDNIRNYMSSKFVAERLLNDPDPELKKFMAGFKNVEPGFFGRIMRTVLNIKPAPQDSAQLVANYLKGALKFEVKNGLLTVQLANIDRDIGYILFSKALYYADLVHYENSRQLMDYAQDEMNSILARTQDINVRRFLVAQIYNKVVSSVSLKPEPPYFYSIVYPIAHQPLKTTKGFIINQAIVLFLVVGGFGFYILFVKPYLAEKNRPADAAEIAPIRPRLSA